eukprot:2645118-Amphidinium_carterae.2
MESGNHLAYRWTLWSLGSNLNRLPVSSWQSDWVPSTCPVGGTLENRIDVVCSASGNRLDYRWPLWIPGGHLNKLPFSTRQSGWLPPTCRVGEAKTPGPSICSVNLGGWSRVEPTLLLKHDIVAVQETFVL